MNIGNDLAGRCSRKKNARRVAGIVCALNDLSDPGVKAHQPWRKANNPVLSMVITRPAAVVAMVVTMPTAVGENDAATQGEYGQQGNQPSDSTQHFKNPHGYAAMKPKLFSGCNMRPRLCRRIPVKG
ncbi:hypothetical protein [Pseudomonas sp. PB106]|uniref:hypothetical protein n=1 Tax=Pseudomonas sp. PB106 TaxID=2494699 RepID=UPI0015B5DAFD|nr:hypothetical protein [Pseudomonas sp. PB106]